MLAVIMAATRGLIELVIQGVSLLHRHSSVSFTEGSKAETRIDLYSVFPLIIVHSEGPGIHPLGRVLPSSMVLLEHGPSGRTTSTPLQHVW